MGRCAARGMRGEEVECRGALRIGWGDDADERSKQDWRPRIGTVRNRNWSELDWRSNIRKVGQTVTQFPYMSSSIYVIISCF